MIMWTRVRFSSSSRVLPRTMLQARALRSTPRAAPSSGRISTTSRTVRPVAAARAFAARSYASGPRAMPRYTPVQSHLLTSSLFSSSSPIFRPTTVYTPVRLMSAEAPTFLKDAEVEKRVVDLVKTFGKVDPKAVTRQSHFINDLGLDSLDEVELLLAAEDEFSLEIPDPDAEKIHSVEDLIRYLCSQPNAK